jgi:hypothetical protein
VVREFRLAAPGGGGPDGTGLDGAGLDGAGPDGTGPDDTALVEAVAWASFAAARQVGSRYRHNGVNE